MVQILHKNRDHELSSTRSDAASLDWCRSGFRAWSAFPSPRALCPFVCVRQGRGEGQGEGFSKTMTCSAIAQTQGDIAPWPLTQSLPRIQAARQGKAQRGGEERCAGKP